jgi:hypothetical protein
MDKKEPVAQAALAESTAEEEQARLDLVQRLKESALSSSLTLLSIIQGVALADLAGVVADNYARFALVQWLLVATTFLLLIAAWNQITMDTLAWVSLPNVEGYLIPFIVGGFELFLNHALALNIQAWLIGAAIMAALSMFGIWYTGRRVAQHAENAALLAHLQPYRRSGMRYNLFGGALLLLLALLGGLGVFTAFDRAIMQPGAANLIAAALAGGWLLLFLRRHFYYWRVVTAYAQSKAAPKKKHQRARHDDYPT